MSEPAPLLVFADDWGRHPSSCQHLVRRLLPRRAVYWVNTIMRPPRLDRATLKRGWEKARHWLQPSTAAEPPPANPQILSPRMWPWFASRFDRRLNRWLLARLLQPIIRRRSAPPVVLTTLPIVADLIGVLPVARWIYYCVDDFGTWPGLDGPALRRMEEQLVRDADEIIAVSENLCERIAQMGRPAHLLTHGVEPEFWAPERVAGEESTKYEVRSTKYEVRSTKGTKPGEAPSAPGTSYFVPRTSYSSLPPLVVYWGVIDRRLDVEFVRRLAHDLTDGTIVLAGPIDNPDPALLRLPRIVHLGPLPFEQLPALAREASVLIAPYADLPVTRAMQPLKLKEYLATGKPVVARDLPAIRPWSDCLDLAAEADEFSRAVRLRISDGVPEEQSEARGRLASESWDAKADELERWLCGPVPRTVCA